MDVVRVNESGHMPFKICQIVLRDNRVKFDSNLFLYLMCYRNRGRLSTFLPTNGMGQSWQNTSTVYLEEKGIEEYCVLLGLL